MIRLDVQRHLRRKVPEALIDTSVKSSDRRCRKPREPDRAAFASVPFLPDRAPEAPPPRSVTMPVMTARPGSDRAGCLSGGGFQLRRSALCSRIGSRADPRWVRVHSGTGPRFPGVRRAAESGRCQYQHQRAPPRADSFHELLLDMFVAWFACAADPRLALLHWQVPDQRRLMRRTRFRRWKPAFTLGCVASEPSQRASGLLRQRRRTSGKLPPPYRRQRTSSAVNTRALPLRADTLQAFWIEAIAAVVLVCTLPQVVRGGVWRHAEPCELPWTCC